MVIVESPHMTQSSPFVRGKDRCVVFSRVSTVFSCDRRAEKTSFRKKKEGRGKEREEFRRDVLGHENTCRQHCFLIPHARLLVTRQSVHGEAVLINSCVGGTKKHLSFPLRFIANLFLTPVSLALTFPVCFRTWHQMRTGIHILAPTQLNSS